VLPHGTAGALTAFSSCNQHGTWRSEPLVVSSTPAQREPKTPKKREL
jgi:hypothetical protein